MTTIVTILTDRYADWECALIMAVGRSYYGLSVLTASPGGGPLTSAGGLTVTPDMDLKDIDPHATKALLVNGGEAWLGSDAPDIASLLRAAHAAGGIVAGICAGTIPLAGAGLLDNVAHTGNSAKELAAVPGYCGAVHYADSPSAVSDGRIVTAPGTAPVSFMERILDGLGQGGDELAWYVGRHAAEHRPAA